MSKPIRVAGQRVAARNPEPLLEYTIPPVTFMGVARGSKPSPRWPVSHDCILTEVVVMSTTGGDAAVNGTGITVLEFYNGATMFGDMWMDPSSQVGSLQTLVGLRKMDYLWVNLANGGGHTDIVVQFRAQYIRNVS